MPTVRCRVCLTASAAALAFVIAGCGSGADTNKAGHRSRSAAAGAATTPSPGRGKVGASASAVSVIRSWANALRSGDVVGAARYFALPSEMINGVGANGEALIIRIRTPAQAVFANTTLPCGARFISARQRGRFVNALFLLTGRPGPGGSNCGGDTGASARTNFVIADGRIVEWVRAPSEPGDPGTAAQPTTPTTPTSPAPPGQETPVA